MTKPTQVLHLLPDLKTGGGQILLLDQIKCSDPALFRHVVCFVRPLDEMSDQYRAAGVEVIGLGIRRRPHLLTAFLWLLWLVISRGVDIVHANNTPEDMRFAVPLCNWTKRPLVVTLHGYFAGRRPPKKQAHFDALWRRAARQLSAVIAVSEPVRESWNGHFRNLGQTEDSILTIRPVIDLARFEALDAKDGRQRLLEEFGLEQDARVAISVSRLVEGKGLALLIDAMSKVEPDVPNAHLVLVGDGPLHSTLLELARQRGIADKVIFAGNRSDVPQLLVGSDAFVFASESESFGLAPCEAMAAGLPVVLAALPSLQPIMVEGKTARIVDQGDTKGFAQALATVLLDTDLANEMGRAGAVRATELFGAEESAQRLAALYQRGIAAH